MKKKKIKILLVDDDHDIIEFLSHTFLMEGYKVQTASNGAEAIEKAKKEIPDVIVMDVKMPKMDGMEAVAILRKLPEFEHVMITFLTASNEDYLQVAGYNVGADDYIAKPIRPKLLVTKIKALLRRKENTFEPYNDTVTLGGFDIHADENRIAKEGCNIYLAKREFDLFCLLASNPGKVFKRAEILDRVWTNETVGRRTIDVHILKLREKVGSDYFRSIIGVGYKFEFPLISKVLVSILSLCSI